MSAEEKKFITDDLEIIDFFRVLFRSKEKLWLWQQMVNEGGERPVHYCMVRKVNVLAKSIELTPLSEEGFSFKTKENPLFLYSSRRNIAVKFTPRELEQHYIMLGFPSRLNSLSQDLASKIDLVEKENEIENLHKRKQPRKQVSGDQTISLIKTKGARTKIYNLYDISAGGLALKSQDPGEFSKNEIITIIAINGKNLDSPLTGKVVSIRHMIEDDLFKVGVQFI